MPNHHDRGAAARQVFNTYELVTIIAKFLDALSLLRVQRVNRTFRNVIKDTTSLQKRIGFMAEKEVLDVTKIDDGDTCDFDTMVQLDEALLESLIILCHGQWTLGGPTDDRNFGDFFLLPRATKAAVEPTSSVHTILLTDPPINAVIVKAWDNAIAPLGPSHITAIENAKGVTIGAVLLALVEMGFDDPLDVPLGLDIRWSFYADDTIA